MRSTTIGKTQPALALSAFGFELRLWQESEVEWRATIEEGEKVHHSQFEEDNLMLAKLHILEEARARGVYIWKDREFPTCESLVDSWKSIANSDPTESRVG